jgi:FixJ family two-component response regulator
VDDVRVGVQTKKKGADDYLVKPFNLEAVEVSVQRALEEKRMELDLDNYRQNLKQMVDQRREQLQTAARANS